MYCHTPRQNITRCANTLRHSRSRPVTWGRLPSALQVTARVVTQLFGRSALQTQACAETQTSEAIKTQTIRQEIGLSSFSRGISPRYEQSQLATFTARTNSSHIVQSESSPLVFWTLPLAIPTIVSQIVQLWAYLR